VQFGVPQLGSWSPAVRPVHCRCHPGRCQTRSAAVPVCGRVCVTTSVDDVVLAVDRLARCVSDVDDWMSLSRLRLNSSKTQASWLGYKSQIDINIKSVAVLLSSDSVVDSVRHLGVVMDSRLTTSDHAFWLYYQLRQLRPVARALPEAAAKTQASPGVYILLARLLQRAALRYHGQLVSASAVDPERNSATSDGDGHQATRPHLTSSVTFALVASEATGRLQTAYIGLQVAVCLSSQSWMASINKQKYARRNPSVPRE